MIDWSGLVDEAQGDLPRQVWPWNVKHGDLVRIELTLIDEPHSIYGVALQMVDDDHMELLLLNDDGTRGSAVLPMEWVSWMKPVDGVA